MWSQMSFVLCFRCIWLIISSRNLLCLKPECWGWRMALGHTYWDPNLISICLCSRELKPKPFTNAKLSYSSCPVKISPRLDEVGIKFPWDSFSPWPCCAFLLTILVLRIPATQKWAVVSPLAHTVMKTSCKLSKSDLMFVDSRRVAVEQQAKSSVSVSGEKQPLWHQQPCLVCSRWAGKCAQLLLSKGGVIFTCRAGCGISAVWEWWGSRGPVSVFGKPQDK